MTCVLGSGCGRGMWFLSSVCASAGIPVWISWLKYLSFVFYGYGQLVHVEFKDRQLYSCTDPNAAAGMHTHTRDAAQSVCLPVHCKQACMEGACGYAGTCCSQLLFGLAVGVWLVYGLVGCQMSALQR